ncbi:hypothetical protein K438DRAFT_1847958 [Mycena galopus ATCC 62051]|nr:hypothetical protein K438DRAFT_1847958 [Mycena galopus ATCC 62051]
MLVAHARSLPPCSSPSSCTPTLLADPCPSHPRSSRASSSRTPTRPARTYSSRMAVAHATPPCSCAATPVARTLVVHAHPLSQTPVVAYVKAPHTHPHLIVPANPSHPVVHATPLRPYPPTSVAREVVVHAHSRPSQARIVSRTRRLSTVQP